MDPAAIRVAVGKGRYDAYIAQRSPAQQLADAQAMNDTQRVKALTGQVVDGPATITVDPSQGGKTGAMAQIGIDDMSGYSRGPDLPNGGFILYRNGPGGVSTVPTN